MRNSVSCDQGEGVESLPGCPASGSSGKGPVPSAPKRKEGLQEINVERRNAIGKGLTRFLYGIAGLMLAYPAFAFMTFRKVTRKNVVFHPQDQLPPVNFKDGVYLVKVASETYALSSRCTHLGCTLNYDPVSQRFRCPCHGSVFDLSGERLAGPARKPLERVPTFNTKNKDVIAVLPL